MRKIQNKINIALHNYQPGDYLPIFVDGKWVNRKQFVTYKVSRFAKGQLI